MAERTVKFAILDRVTQRRARRRAVNIYGLPAGWPGDLRRRKASPVPSAARSPLVGVLVALGVIAIAMASFWVMTQSADHAAKRREQILVDNGLAGRMQEAENAAMSETMWDEAVRNLDLKYDPAWAHANVGQYFNQTAGFEISYVLDGADKAIFAMEGDTLKPATAFNRFALAAAPLLEKTRKAEAARGPFHFTPGDNKMVTEPIQASAIVSDSGRVYMLTATLVQPDFGRALPRARAPIVFTGEAIDAGFLKALSSRYLLDGLTMTSPDAEIAPQDARVPLRNGGTTLAVLRWAPQRPGAALFASAAPPLLGVLTVFAGVAIWLWLRGRKMAGEARAAEARAEASRAADMAKSAFLAKMSHELRTPLNAIIGYSEILQDGAAAAKRTQEYADHDRILIAARHLLSLINDLLDLSRIEAGRMDTHPSAFDAGQVCVELVDLMQPAAKANGNALLFAPDNTLGAAFTDQRLLKQCLINLLSNACKFTKDGRVTLRAERQGDEFVFQVCDTGIGMTPEQIADLFAPFAQASPDIRNRFGGSGLGLALTRELARVLGGDVSVISDPKFGSVVTLRVRASVREDMAGEQAA
jgi:signal transduction histidine kinase